MSARVLVTGGSSHLGEYVLRSLASTGAQVSAVVRSQTAGERVSRLGASPAERDLTDLDGWRPPAADLLLHVAGVRLSAPAARLARAAGCRAAVCVSSASAAATGHPSSAEIRAHEDALLAEAVPWSVLRPTMIFGGKRDRNVRPLATALSRLPAVPRVRGGSLVQPVLVDDLAEAVVRTGERALHGAPLREPVAVGGARALTIGELIDDVCTRLALRRLAVVVPAGRLARLVQQIPGAQRSRFAHAVGMLTVDRSVTDAAAVLGLQPTGWDSALDTALRRYGLLAGRPAVDMGRRR